MRRDTIKAKVRVAKAQQTVNKIGASVAGADKNLSAFDKIEAKADKMLDEANAMAELNQSGRDNTVENLKDKYTVSSPAVDDELAAILSHEIAHDMDFYDGFGKLIVMKFNSKAYEYKADEIGIDYMVKAGYNPIAMITIMNKIGGESIFDWGTFTSHPKTSSRLMKDYEYIYKKYPSYLTSPMVKNIYYVNWTNTAQKDIQKFQQREKERASKRGSI